MSAPLAGEPVVVTGQQAGLFGGPLYTLTKLVGAVALARAEGARAVFWIECDDADVREVDRAVVLDREGEIRSFSLGESDDGRPVAARTLGAGVTGLLEDLARALPEGERARSEVAALAVAYAPGRRWHEAFAAYLADLASGLDVLLFDPSAPAAKAAAAPLFRRVLDQADEVELALAAGAAEVTSPQAPYRPGELPLFVLDADGRRRKVERRAEGFALKGQGESFGRAALLELLATHPERFSPAVELRPVVQDSLLPTLAYVAGPAERAYHAQLAPLYRLLEVAQPRLVPRPHLVVLDARARRALERLDATLEVALEGEAALLARVATLSAGFDAEAEAKAAIPQLLAALAPLRTRLVPLGPGPMAKHFEEAEATISYHLGKLGQRARALAERRDADLRAQATKAARLLLPLGQPQERVYCPIQVLARTRREDLVGGLLERIDPSDPGRTIVLELP